ERFLAVDVLAELERRERRVDVRVLAGAHDHRVESLGVVEQLAEVGEGDGVLVPAGGGGQVLGVHVTQGGDVLGLGDLTHVAATATPATDDGDVDLAVQITAADERRGGQYGGGGPEERAAGEGKGHWRGSGAGGDSRYPTGGTKETTNRAREAATR